MSIWHSGKAFGMLINRTSAIPTGFPMENFELPRLTHSAMET